jgi:hypothetical protein
MYSAKGHLASPRWGCPIRTSPDQSLLAAPRGLSQPSTSFIGSWCQGIHRAPLLARRLDLSTSPSRQDQRSHKKTHFKKTSNHNLQTQYACLGTSTESDACSTTLRFFRCLYQCSLERRSWRLDLKPGNQGATTNSPAPSAGVGTKIARRSVEPPRPTRQSVSGNLCGWRLQLVDNPSLHRSFSGAHANQRLVRIPRMFTISSCPSSVQATHKRGGAEGIRTPDLRLAKAALSQLSYGPAPTGVGQPGIEPGTSVLSGLRSSRLSYWPKHTERSGVYPTRAQHLKGAGPEVVRVGGACGPDDSKAGVLLT